MIGMTVCSGIGAPEHAAPWIDWRYQSEIEPFPRAVLAHRFPDAVNLGDMTKFKEWPDADVDVLCGGTPCQSFSVAGLRKGLDDPRGNLMLTYLAIAARYRPRWMVWENVPGVLSSNGGRDFGSFLGGLGELGYGFAYRVLDVQFGRTLRFPWAIPQRRRRVFVVGYLGDWRRAAAVLFDRDSLSGHPPPRREAGQVDSPTISARPTGGGGLGTDFDLDGGLVPSHDAAQPLLSKANSSHRLDAESVVAVANSADKAFTICANSQNFLDAETETLIATISGEGSSHALTGEGHDAGEDGSGRGTPIVAVAIQDNAVSENPDAGPDGAGWNAEGAAYTIEARNNVQTVAFDLNQITSKTNRSQPDPDILHTLPASSCPPHLATPWSVRRLTPLECERLMGFPDCFTAIPMQKRNRLAETEEMRAYFDRTGQDEAIRAGLHMAADGPRYKALGNSWGVNCGEYIFERIRMVNAARHEPV